MGLFGDSNPGEVYCTRCGWSGPANHSHDCLVKYKTRIAALESRVRELEAENARLRAIPRIDDLAAMNLLADRTCDSCSCDVGETCAYCEVAPVLNEIGSIIDEWKRAALKGEG